MVSVVVPVYNVENYLRRCLDSILNQSFQDFELIIVDDGSTDSSSSICDEYKLKGPKVKVIHQNNQGLSIARNIGVDNSLGEYITFIDSDDYVHKDYLLVLMNLIKEYNAELSCCSFHFFSDYVDSDLINKMTYKSYSLPGEDAMIGMLYGKIHGSSACAMIIKSEIVRKYRFQPGKYHEDDLVSFHYFNSAVTVGITTEPLYYYYQRVGSITHRPFGKIALDELGAGDYIFLECSKINKKSMLAAASKKFDNYTNVLLNHPDVRIIDSQIYEKINQTLKELSSSILFNKNVGKRNRLIAFGFIIYTKLGLFLLNKLR